MNQQINMEEVGKTQDRSVLAKMMIMVTVN